jgi:hypothetical protein
MYAFGIGDLEQVMKIPVPFRKWLIGRWNKQKEKEMKMHKQDPDVPLNPWQKAKIQNESKQVRNDPSTFLQPMRKPAPTVK